MIYMLYWWILHILFLSLVASVKSRIEFFGNISIVWSSTSIDLLHAECSFHNDFGFFLSILFRCKIFFVFIPILDEFAFRFYCSFNSCLLCSFCSVFVGICVCIGIGIFGSFLIGIGLVFVEIKLEKHFGSWRTMFLLALGFSNCLGDN